MFKSCHAVFGLGKKKKKKKEYHTLKTWAWSLETTKKVRKLYNIKD